MPRLPRTAYLLCGLLLCVASGLSKIGNAQERGAPRFGPSLQADTVTTSADALGRVWSFANLPSDLARDIKGGAVGTSDRQHAMQSTVRLPDCSGALTSSQGLVLTAARCLRGHLDPADSSKAVLASRPKRDRNLAGVHVDRLVRMGEVTARIDSLRRAFSQQNNDRRSALQQAITQVERQRRADGGEQHRVDVVSEAGGERYVAYTYRRFEDVRLVFHPDLEVTTYGQSNNRLSYPQSSWDVALLRVYEDGEPAQTPTHFEVEAQGTRPGDSVFALGYPTQTHRVETARQFAFRRDVMLPARRAALEGGATHLQTYVDTSATSSRAWTRKLRSARDERQRVSARLHALQSDYVMERLQQRDERLRRRAQAAGLKTDVEEKFDRLAALQEEKRTYAETVRAFSFMRRSHNRSATLARAVATYRAVQNDREDPVETFQSISVQPTAVDAALLDDHLHALRTYLDADSTLARMLDGVGDPTRIVRESVFSAPDSVRARLKEGDSLTDDPGWSLAAGLVERFSTFREEWKAIQNEERMLLKTLDRVRHRLAEEPLTLPRARALRLANGHVGGYPYNGTVAPPVTTFHGLFGRFAAGSSDRPSSLPPPWQSPPSDFRRATPLTTVADTDLMGEYGSPLVNTSLQLVGLQVDDNVQAAAGAYLFLPHRMRTVSVDMRGVLEGLAHIYDADALVHELTAGEFTAK